MKLIAQTRPSPFGVSAQIALLLMVSILMWMTGLPSWLSNARAAALFDLSDTLTDSDLSALSAHRFNFTTTNALDAGDTIEITFDPGTGGGFDEFTLGDVTAATFLSESGIDVVASCTGASSEATVATSSSSGDDKVILTVCATDTISAGAKTFQIGATSSPVITNPSASGSQVIRIQSLDAGTTVLDTGDARVYIIDDVTVTASVDSTFTFSITGVANGQTGEIVNNSGTSTATTTTSTLVPFETLTPNTSKVLSQRLDVTTNAANGYSVTVFEDQNLTSSTGADIDVFSNGATTSFPIAWTTPLNTPNSDQTFGHFGISSSDDVTSSSTNPGEWGTGGGGTDLWAGNFLVPREVMYHNAPVTAGLNNGEGYAYIVYQIEIDTLQEAGSDYTNTLTFVATPVF